MMYLVAIASLLALIGFFWALRSALLEKVGLESQVIDAKQSREEKQRDMLLHMSQTLSELSERMKNLEDTSRGNPRVVRRASVGAFNLDLVVLNQARIKNQTEVLVAAHQRILQNSSLPRQEFVDNSPIGTQAENSFNEEIAAQVARAISQASTPIH
ncbi:hypothetical protein [Variovorax sp. 770b2]|uniref:hypothetical protein n=1 Tax=Variovorax sp. 770b2 TaxID=1566271 RepID=UPI001160C992|nr:hypothetical protein [Variovorax sp. 770b2]